jgi:hypothetical protein
MELVADALLFDSDGVLLAAVILDALSRRGRVQSGRA